MAFMFAFFSVRISIPSGNNTMTRARLLLCEKNFCFLLFLPEPKNELTKELSRETTEQQRQQQQQKNVNIWETLIKREKYEKGNPHESSANAMYIYYNILHS